MSKYFESFHEMTILSIYKCMVLQTLHHNDYLYHTTSTKSLLVRLCTIWCHMMYIVCKQQGDFTSSVILPCCSKQHIYNLSNFHNINISILNTMARRDCCF